MTKKSLLILEVIWIVIGIASAIAGVHNAINTGGKRLLIFLLMTIVAFGMAWLRHNQRKKG
jgi:tryptophan-rich sensory protein